MNYYYKKNFFLIFKNESSEIREYYNTFKLKFIEYIYQWLTNIKQFDIIESIKKDWFNYKINDWKIFKKN